jgi:glycerophosphoryl diester phosphodiesterase
MPQFVAHAGGAINWLTYTNSLEALNYNYNKGFRFFEIDFEFTSDKRLVLLHDWSPDNLTKLFHAKPGVYSLIEFKNFKMINNLTQMSLGDLADWMFKHPDAYIITDIKSNNMEGLNKISKECPTLKGRFMPQIYTFEEYDEAKIMGFKNIILTLYASDYKDEQVLEFLNNHKVIALTMLDYRATKDFVYKLKKIGVFIYVHTVNDATLKNQLKAQRVDGFYTDFLGP